MYHSASLRSYTLMGSFPPCFSPSPLCHLARVFALSGLWLFSHIGLTYVRMCVCKWSAGTGIISAWLDVINTAVHQWRPLRHSPDRHTHRKSMKKGEKGWNLMMFTAIFVSVSYNLVNHIIVKVVILSAYECIYPFWVCVCACVCAIWQECAECPDCILSWILFSVLFLPLPLCSRTSIPLTHISLRHGQMSHSHTSVVTMSVTFHISEQLQECKKITFMRTGCSVHLIASHFFPVSLCFQMLACNIGCSLYWSCHLMFPRWIIWHFRRRSSRRLA